jgi:hypothetical protein
MERFNEFKTGIGNIFGCFDPDMGSGRRKL